MAGFKFLHTTKVEPAKTAGQIMELLCRLGASDIIQRVEDKEVAGTGFRVEIEGEWVEYRLPIRWQPIFDYYVREHEAKPRKRALKEGEAERAQEAMKAQAKRTAWRIVLEWLKVQLSFVDIGVRNALEVFMADMVVPGRKETVGELMAEGGIRALLPAPEAEGGKSR